MAGAVSSSSARESRNVFYVCPSSWACGWYRCYVPGVELKRRGHDVRLDTRITPEDVAWADVIVLQRQWDSEVMRAAVSARSQGKMVVYELDDDLWNPHPTNPVYAAWTDARFLAGAEALIRVVDVVTTTTPPLARELRKLNPKVRVLPNMLPAEHWRVIRDRPEGYDTLTIGWAGSTARRLDLNVMRAVIPQILDSHPRVSFLLAPGDVADVFPPHPRINVLEPTTIELYPTLLAQFDIGIAPVVDSRFNQAKSDLKFVEYGMLGLPVVASAVECYVHSIKHGENGFLAKNDKDWLKYLRRLIEDVELRDLLGQAARAFAEARTIEKNIWLWEDAYGLERSETRQSPDAV